MSVKSTKDKPKGSFDSGPAIGSLLPGAFLDKIQDHGQQGGATNHSAKLYLFTSMYCAYCIDLLPHISTIQEEFPSFSLYLFSTGDEEDHQNMREYFNWEFPIVHLDQSDMEAYASVTHLPYMILTDEKDKVMAKGVIYDASDFRQTVSPHMSKFS